MALGWSFDPGMADLDAKLKPKLIAAIQDGLDLIERDAVQTAPYRTGDLASSSKTKVDPSTLEGSVWFGDPKAVAAHENMHVHYRNGRRAKFLELSAQENADAMTLFIAAAFVDVFG